MKIGIISGEFVAVYKIRGAHNYIVDSYDLHNGIPELMDKNVENGNVLRVFSNHSCEVVTFYEKKQNEFLIWNEKNETLGEYFHLAYFHNKIITNSGYPFLIFVKESTNWEIHSIKSLEELVQHINANVIEDIYIAPNSETISECYCNCDRNAFSVKYNNKIVAEGSYTINGEQQEYNMHFYPGNSLNWLQTNKNIVGADFVIKGYVLSANDRYESIRAVFPVITKSGEFKQVSAYAYYDRDKKIYFITDKDFSEVEKLGTVPCKIIDYYRYKRYGLPQNSFDGNLAAHSPLNEMGYSVSQEIGLTDSERHAMLAYFIDYEIFDRSIILYYLEEVFIKMRNSRRNYYYKAISKWENDAAFVKQYKADEFRNVSVNSVSVPNGQDSMPIPEGIVEELPFT